MFDMAGVCVACWRCVASCVFTRAGTMFWPYHLPYQVGPPLCHESVSSCYILCWFCMQV